MTRDELQESLNLQDNLQAFRTYEELTEEERNVLVFPYTTSAEDYARYHVQYNKKGQLLRVEPKEFSASKKAKIEEASKRPNIMDICMAAAGKQKGPHMTKMTAEERAAVRKVFRG